MSKKSYRDPPSWAYEDNIKSKFGIIYDDLLKSKKFRSLSLAAQRFYITLVVHSSTEKAKECLYNALSETYELMGEGKSTFDIKAEVYDERKKLFVFPKKQYEEYGYTKAYTSKYLNELTERGFISVWRSGKHQRKVSIYEFSSKWKK